MGVLRGALPVTSLPARVPTLNTGSRNPQRGSFIFTALLALTAVSALAQVSSSVVGFVSDRPGARIPGTTVTVTNAETGMRLISIATNSAAGIVGEHQVKQLPLNGRSRDPESRDSQ